MADEVNLHVLMPGTPQSVMTSWRTEPPEAFRSDGLKLVDEAYDTLVYASRYYDWPQKLMFVTSLGFALLFKGFLGSRFRLTARFEEDAGNHTRVTIAGTAHPRTRRRLADFAAQQGGSVGLRVGV